MRCSCEWERLVKRRMWNRQQIYLKEIIPTFFIPIAKHSQSAQSSNTRSRFRILKLLYILILKQIVQAILSIYVGYIVLNLGIYVV